MEFDAMQMQAKQSLARVEALADRLAAELGLCGPDLEIDSPESDEVSSLVTLALNAVGKEFLSVTGEGIREIRDVAATLRWPAQTFGLMDDENSAEVVSVGGRT